VTTPYEAENAAVQRWFANWTGTAQTFLEGEDAKPTRGVAHSVLTVVQTGGQQRTLGRTNNRRFRRTSEVQIQINTPSDSGTKQANTLAQEARAIFEATSFGGLRFFAADIQKIGVDGEWLIFLVTCPFDYQEIK